VFYGPEILNFIKIPAIGLKGDVFVMTDEDCEKEFMGLGPRRVESFLKARGVSAAKLVSEQTCAKTEESLAGMLPLLGENGPAHLVYAQSRPLSPRQIFAKISALPLSAVQNVPGSEKDWKVAVLLHGGCSS
jgi:hypothetical protein